MYHLHFEKIAILNGNNNAGIARFDALHCSLVLAGWQRSNSGALAAIQQDVLGSLGIHDICSRLPPLKLAG